MDGLISTSHGMPNGENRSVALHPVICLVLLESTDTAEPHLTWVAIWRTLHSLLCSRTHFEHPSQ